jgi:hypothetical protein
MTLKLEAGKYYVNGYGDKVGPAKEWPHSVYCFTLNDLTHTDSGQYHVGHISQYDLVSEWVEPKVEPDVLPFGKLTPEEQGELLLARHMGETIEVHDHYNWGLAFGPAWYGSMSYRIKPKPKMQAEYWVVFTKLGLPKYVTMKPSQKVAYSEYKVHHPAVEIKE